MDSDSVTVVAIMDVDSQPYEFHQYGIFFDPGTLTYWVGFDSGCSCPIPWDGVELDGPYTGIQALRETDLMAAVHENRHTGGFVDGYRRVRATLQEHIMLNSP